MCSDQTSQKLVCKMDLTYLKSKCSNENITMIIQNTSWAWQVPSSDNMYEIKENVNILIERIIQEYFEDSSDIRIHNAIHCVVFNCVWSTLQPLVRAVYILEDSYLHEKSVLLCRYEYDENIEDSLIMVPLTAATVELSMIDAYSSPLEMMNCLSATYDLIFAEIKSALINLIAKTSENEVEIPIINKDEVLMSILKVIIKSKMLHFCSNIYYIKIFGEKILESDRHLRTIVRDFERAMNLFSNFAENIRLKKRNQIDTCEMMELLWKEELSDGDEKSTLESERRKRLISIYT
ncbi:hypothetical protein JTB14_002458 [Gonioctena quinquepunctata]|nr:hypothetical protein JTB14_002458 [Gonioctena quinquepunctata]